MSKAHMYAPDAGYGHYPPHQGYPPPAVNNHTVVSQPTQNVVVNAGGMGTRNQKREWSTQKFACLEDVSGCMCAICCTPCFLANLATRQQEYICLACCVPQALLAMFVKVRAENKIRGSICHDCVWTSCCPGLAMCQLKRELDNIDKRKPKTEL